MAEQEIVLVFQSDTYRAYLANNPSIYGTGETQHAAIGQMIDFNREHFGFGIKFQKPETVELRPPELKCE